MSAWSPTPTAPRPNADDWVPSLLLDIAVPLGAIGIATAVGRLVDSVASEVDLVMVYLLAITLASAWVRLASAVLSAALAVVAFNFFFVHPVHTFLVADVHYLITFGGMLAVGVTISSLAARLRERARVARQRAWRTRELYALTRRLSMASDPDDVLQRAVASLSSLVDGPVLIHRRQGDALRRAAWSGRGDWSEEDDRRSEAMLRGAQVEEPGTVRLRLEAGDGCLGILTLQTSSHWYLREENRRLLDAAAAQIALTLERAILEEEARAARLTAEVEKTRSALLSAVSHDLRTPLGSIKGAATTLLDGVDRLAPAERRRLLTDISSEADRLARMLANLLEMTRIEGGTMELQGDWHAPEDVVGAALRNVRGLDQNRVVVQIPNQLVLAWMDPLLLELVLVNLLENAVHYAPEGAIEVQVGLHEDSLFIDVRDEGPGFDEPAEDLLERFVRGRTRGGTGLGLAICKAVIELHDGTLHLWNRPDGGAAVRVVLPRGGPDRLEPPSLDVPDAEEPP